MKAEVVREVVREVVDLVAVETEAAWVEATVEESEGAREEG